MVCITKLTSVLENRGQRNKDVRKQAYNEFTIAQTTEVRDFTNIPIIFLRVGSRKSTSVLSISWEFNSSTNKPGCWFNGYCFMVTWGASLWIWSWHSVLIHQTNLKNQNFDMSFYTDKKKKKIRAGTKDRMNISCKRKEGLWQPVVDWCRLLWSQPGWIGKGRWRSNCQNQPDRNFILTI